MDIGDKIYLTDNEDFTSHKNDSNAHVSQLERESWNNATKVESSDTNGNIKINGTEKNVYTHPTHTSKSSGLYKVAVDDTGHVSETSDVTKEDIVDLGIPGEKFEIIEITQEEYDALTPEQQKAGNYLITDGDNTESFNTDEFTVFFNEADTRENIVSGEQHRTIFGKICKWFTDLKTVAFTGSYKDLINTPNNLTFVNVVVAKSLWKSDTTYKDYPYKARITLSGITANHIPYVNLSMEDSIKGILAPVTVSANGYITMYSSELPNTFTIPNIYAVMHETK